MFFSIAPLNKLVSMASKFVSIKSDFLYESNEFDAFENSFFPSGDGLFNVSLTILEKLMASF